jgi:hypothetical protein
VGGVQGTLRGDIVHYLEECKNYPRLWEHFQPDDKEHVVWSTVDEVLLKITGITQDKNRS